MAAGTDATTTTIEWGMSELFSNTRVLKKLQDELERVVGMEQMVRESDLPRLPYLQAVAIETLRFHLPAGFPIPHLSMEPCNVLGYEIPRDTRVYLNVWVIGRNPKAWMMRKGSFPRDSCNVAPWMRECKTLGGFLLELAGDGARESS